ncbi:unnamed protein product [Trichobilharzia regenti]|nr:unnamed protein product [Trichobilharzia regenti]
MQYRISQYDYEAIKLTHEVCCNALGIAWGEPCQTCHTTHCGKGFEEIDGVCKDINECEVDGVCQRGQCVNEEGSYKCNCPENTYFDKTALECVYIQKSPCESDPYRCNNGGKCIDLPSGDYKCVCPWGTKTSQDKRSCTTHPRLILQQKYYLNTLDDLIEFLFTYINRIFLTLETRCVIDLLGTCAGKQFLRVICRQTTSEVVEKSISSLQFKLKYALKMLLSGEAMKACQTNYPAQRTQPHQNHPPKLQI